MDTVQQIEIKMMKLLENNEEKQKDLVLFNLEKKS